MEKDNNPAPNEADEQITKVSKTMNLQGSMNTWQPRVSVNHILYRFVEKKNFSSYFLFLLEI